MKAVVLEIQNGVAAVLREDGTVVKVRRNCRVGETIELGRRPLSAPALRFVRGAVAAALAVMILGGSYAYNTAFACSYVSLDSGDASLEYTLNRRGQVLSVRALSSGAASVADRLSGSVRRQPLSEAVKTALELLREEGSCVLASVASDSEERTDRLSQTLTDTAAEEGDARVYVVSSTLEERRAASEQGVSTGRYAIIRTITDAADPSGEGVSSAEVETYQNTPVDQLLRDAGAAAPAAASGASGTAGDPGTGGAAGGTGTNGTAGNPGTNGTAGGTGTGGTTGNPGTNGTTGNPGTNGTTGSTGTGGAAGNPGTNGTAGGTGTAGTGGSSGTIGTPGGTAAPAAPPYSGAGAGAAQSAPDAVSGDLTPPAGAGGGASGQTDSGVPARP